MPDAPDPIRHALGELLRAAFQASAPDPDAPTEAALRAAALLGRPLDELRTDPGATREVVANVLTGAHQLFLDATSDEPERRRAASEALLDLDAHLRSVGIASTDKLADVPDWLAGARDGRVSLPDLIGALAREVREGSDLSQMGERLAGHVSNARGSDDVG